MPSANTFEFASISFANKLSYAKARRYHFVYLTKSLDESRHIHWSKVQALTALIRTGYEYVVWLDLDTMITNMCLEVPTLFPSEQTSIVVQDRSPGVYILRKNEWTIRFLERFYRDYTWYSRIAEKFGKLMEATTFRKLLNQMTDTEREQRLFEAPHFILQSPPGQKNIVNTPRRFRRPNTMEYRLQHPNTSLSFTMHWAGWDPKPYKQMFIVWKLIDHALPMDCRNGTSTYDKMNGSFDHVLHLLKEIGTV